MTNTTTARLASVERALRTSFVLADSKAALALSNTVPSVDNSPGGMIVKALAADKIEADARAFSRDVKQLLKSAVAQAARDLDSVESDGINTRTLADYVAGRIDTCPPGIPSHVAAAAAVCRGTSHAPLLEKQAQLAARNCIQEVERLREVWWSRSKAAATVTGANLAARVYSAAGLDRLADLNARASAKANEIRVRTVTNISRKRLGGNF